MNAGTWTRVTFKSGDASSKTRLQRSGHQLAKTQKVTKSRYNYDKGTHQLSRFNPTDFAWSVGTYLSDIPIVVPYSNSVAIGIPKYRNSFGRALPLYLCLVQTKHTVHNRCNNNNLNWYEIALNRNTYIDLKYLILDYWQTYAYYPSYTPFLTYFAFGSTCILLLRFLLNTKINTKS